MSELDKEELEIIINQAKKVGIVLAVVFFCLFILFAETYKLNKCITKFVFYYNEYKRFGSIELKYYICSINGEIHLNFIEATSLA